MIQAERTGNPYFRVFSKGGVDNVITMTSNNVSQPGFRFVVQIGVINMYGGTTSTTLYIVPNPYNRGILNLRSLMINAINNVTYNPAVIWKYVHNWLGYSATPIIAFANYLNSQVDINIYDGFEVA